MLIIKSILEFLVVIFPIFLLGFVFLSPRGALGSTQRPLKAGEEMKFLLSQQNSQDGVKMLGAELIPA